MSLLRVLGLALSVVSLGCASNHFKAYQGAHPDWSPAATLAREGPVEELLAYFGAPRDSRDRTNRSSLRVYRITADGWSTLRRRDIESGAFQTSQDEDYLVTTRIGCGDTSYFYRFSAHSFAWYYFAANELVAYRHVSYGPLCAVLPHGRRSPEVPLELMRCLDRTIPNAASNSVDVAAECAAVARPGAAADRHGARRSGASPLLPGSAGEGLQSPGGSPGRDTLPASGARS